ncbi:MAG: hypothetical protein K2Q26_08475 [Bdellovibrionales bacterium]|nr:hypothetical protein [Bdellovibrionales bacterium]
MFFLKLFISISCLCLSFSSTAQESKTIYTFQFGVYSNETCRVEVRKLGQYIEFWVEQNALGRYEHGNINYSPLTGDFHDRTTMLGSGVKASRYNETASKIDSDGVQTVKLKFGGVWDARDIVTELSWDLKTGHLQSIMSDRLIAQYSLPNGWHSGPVKERYSKVDCRGLVFSSPIE